MIKNYYILKKDYTKNQTDYLKKIKTSSPNFKKIILSLFNLNKYDEIPCLSSKLNIFAFMSNGNLYNDLNVDNDIIKFVNDLCIFVERKHIYFFKAGYATKGDYKDKFPLVSITYGIFSHTMQDKTLMAHMLLKKVLNYMHLNCLPKDIIRSSIHLVDINDVDTLCQIIDDSYGTPDIPKFDFSKFEKYFDNEHFLCSFNKKELYKMLSSISYTQTKKFEDETN